MIIGTFKAFEALLLFARLSLIDERVELLFFPAVAMRAFFQPLASLCVACNKCTTLPIFAKLYFVSKKIGSTAEILEVVSVDTLCFVVLVVKRTPFCFEVEHVEVEINLMRHDDLMNQADFDVLDGVSEAAKVSILALGDLVWVEVAELSLVLFAVVEAFNSVVCAFALVFFRTLLCLSKFAEFWRVHRIFTSSVLQRVKVVARFVVVGDAPRRTFNALKFIKD